MPGTYSIVKKVTHPVKFACYVKFNEELDTEFYQDTEKYPHGGEYWDFDSLDAKEIHDALQQAADDEYDRLAAEEDVAAQQDSITVDADGHIVT